MTLEETIRAIMREELAALAQQLQAAPPPELVDPIGLARALSVSRSTVYRLINEGCPVVRVGDTPRFDVAEVKAWLRQRA